MLQISVLENCGSIQAMDLPGVMSFAADVDFCVTAPNVFNYFVCSNILRKWGV
jgi:hypothetical protein